MLQAIQHHLQQCCQGDIIIENADGHLTAPSRTVMRWKHHHQERRCMDNGSIVNIDDQAKASIFLISQILHMRGMCCLCCITMENSKCMGAKGAARPLMAPFLIEVPETKICTKKTLDCS